METIRASGHVRRVNRPKHRLRLTMLQSQIRTCKKGADRQDKVMFSPKPSTGCFLLKKLDSNRIKLLDSSFAKPLNWCSDMGLFLYLFAFIILIIIFCALSVSLTRSFCGTKFSLKGLLFILLLLFSTLSLPVTLPIFIPFIDSYSEEQVYFMGANLSPFTSCFSANINCYLADKVR